MTEIPPSTAHAISPDSGLPWAEEGAWQVAAGVHRIPLPLPNDGLRAINVYVLETDEGLTLIDGGWSIQVARDVLALGLKELGYSITDIRRFLVTHVHRDHYAMASVLNKEIGAHTALGRGEELALSTLQGGPLKLQAAIVASLTAAGAPELAGVAADRKPVPDEWRNPNEWLDGTVSIDVGPRTLEAVPTPGHTPGHYVFADREAGALFAGDHVLPTITPSVGFTFPLGADPLGSFLTSLARVRALPDMQILPAHGPVAPSTHTRVHELLAFHEERLSMSLAALGDEPRTGAQVAGGLPWTRRQRSYNELDQFNKQLAALETMAHLDVLVARGQAVRTTGDGTNYYTASKPAMTSSEPDEAAFPNR